MNSSGFWFLRAERQSEAHVAQCRPVVCSIERLRERQEAAGNGLKN
jgi:hypothetical protein